VIPSIRSDSDPVPDPDPFFPEKNPGIIYGVKSSKIKILADYPLGLPLIVIKGKNKIQNFRDFHLKIAGKTDLDKDYYRRFPE
jgi:hypothetical protein